jgi:hypothetical protein
MPSNYSEPWHIEQDDFDTSILASDGSLIAELPDDDYTSVNAALIVHAPETLKLLRRAMSYLYMIEADGIVCEEPVADAIADIEKLVKAIETPTVAA